MRAESIQYLKDAGFDFKPAESPDLWLHLESRFSGPGRVGPKFMSLPAGLVAELITRGEDVLLDALAACHLKTGKLAPVTHVLEMPFVVGTDGTVSLTAADRNRLLDLIDQPGTAKERIVHLLPAKADAIPGTRQVTVTGGLYPDGHTAGFYALSPGNHAKIKEAYAWLATPEEIAALAHEMEQKMEDISIVSRKECEAMIAKVRKILGS